MGTASIDYDALAAQHGGSAQIDYDALAAQHGGSVATAPQPAQPGFFENLGHTFGIGKQEFDAADQAQQDHPIRTLAESALGPGYGAVRAAVTGATRIGGELVNAGKAALNGNPADAAVHAITAVPIVGPALNKMADQAPATTPGQSYMSRAVSAATPGNIGTGLGTATQVAMMGLGGLDAAAPERAMVPNPPVVRTIANAANSATESVKNAISGPPQVQLTKALQPNKNNATWNVDVKPGMQQIKAAEAQMGRPIGGFDDATEAAGLAMKNIWGQVNARLGTAGAMGATIDGNQIADAMMNSIDKRMALQNPGVVERIKALADTYRRPIPTSEAEDFIQSNNKELTGYYARNKVSQQAAQADPETNAKIVEGDAIRDALYSKIDKLTGPGVAQLKKAYGAVRNIQNNLVTQGMVYARKAPVSLGEQLSYFDAAGKALTGNIPGAIKDVAVRNFLSDLNDKNSMIARAFSQTQPAQAFPAPNFPRPVGLLERGPIQTPPPAEGQYVSQTPPPAFSNTTRAERLGLLLPEQTGGNLLPYNPQMTPGEEMAALLHLLRNAKARPALPANASPILLPPPR